MLTTPSLEDCGIENSRPATMAPMETTSATTNITFTPHWTYPVIWST